MESILMAVIGIVITVMFTMFGIVFRRLNIMDSRIVDAPSRAEVDQKIADKQEVVKVIQEEIKDDIKDMRSKIDQLIEIQLKK